MLRKRYDGDDWDVILDEEQAATIAPRILENYPRNTPAFADYTIMPTTQSYDREPLPP